MRVNPMRVKPMRVIVWHNIATDLMGGWEGYDGYRPGHPLVPVCTWTTDTTDHQQLLEDVYRLLNVGDDPAFGTPDPIALRYRRSRNRSLSVGDVVCLITNDNTHNTTDHATDDTTDVPTDDILQNDTEGAGEDDVSWYACARLGWTRVNRPEWFAIGANRPGTTSLAYRDRGRQDPE